MKTATASVDVVSPRPVRPLEKNIVNMERLASMAGPYSGSQG
ncbi:hypothetical protein D187_005427 [Cystobacter fuscus DSM 2262]|uniref:Uncharacterized protein n=1 Tax=Cystobacter fuscus (strain ATCC 25194 / DSM 2262 / NBRC 100088 / M29) TaxID=1242864 RepID=S9R5P1_CYSF2|nr:hypothetical protein D187_005427 [Cystobacter fuscus DSM 2262]